MRFRLTAFGLHLLGSACALSLVLGTLYVGWYHWPGWYLASALHIAGLLVMVDVVIGPTMTLVVANPAKRRRLLARDIATIVAVQLVALGYGATALWRGRPLYYTFSVDRLELVQASDLKPPEIESARRQNPALAPYWYSTPRWVWAPLPQDREEATRIVQSALFGGPDVIQMPRLFKAWSDGLPELRSRLQRLDDVAFFTPREKQALKSRMAQLGLPGDEPNTMVMWGGTRHLLAAFDLKTLRIRSLIEAD